MKKLNIFVFFSAVLFLALPGSTFSQKMTEFGAVTIPCTGLEKVSRKRDTYTVELTGNNQDYKASTVLVAASPEGMLERFDPKFQRRLSHCVNEDVAVFLTVNFIVPTGVIPPLAGNLILFSDDEGNAFIKEEIH